MLQTAASNTQPHPNVIVVFTDRMPTCHRSPAAHCPTVWLMLRTLLMWATLFEPCLPQVAFTVER